MQDEAGRRLTRQDENSKERGSTGQHGAGNPKEGPRKRSGFWAGLGPSFSAGRHAKAKARAAASPGSVADGVRPSGGGAHSGPGQCAHTAVARTPA
jgi:hypothetical protein